MTDDREGQPSDGSVGWRRGLAFAIYLVFGGALARASHGTTGERVVIKLLLSLILLLVVGSISWTVARVRKRPRPWRLATFSRGPYVVAFVLLVLSAVGRTHS